MSGGWGCPHEVRGECRKVQGKSCDPGMKGCVLYGRVVFSDPEKNSPEIRERLEEAAQEKMKKKKREEQPDAARAENSGAEETEATEKKSS